MARRIARVARIVFGVVAVMAVHVGHAKPAAKPHAPASVARGYYPEVRLRKLHLVRPDLIPYPIDYEVYC